MNYLIKDTTREQRLEIVKKALSISLTGAESPSDKALELAKEYVDGKKELKEIQEEIVKEYKKNE